MTAVIQQLIRGADTAVARLYLSLFDERNALLSFLFHSLFRSPAEVEKNHVDPLQRTTTSQFRQFIEYYLSMGYRFISPADLAGGLNASGKYAMITFDDGYFNNTLALPILEEYNVPATFFVSARHVRENKCFWWDVLYRNRVREGLPQRKIWKETCAYKSLLTDQIESRLTERFGKDAFTPWGDIDRPLNASELRDFARHPLVHIGNHTANHAILTNYSREQAAEEIESAQEMLQGMTGRTPIAIAYPNGDHNDQVIDLCQSAGIKMGFTVRPEKCEIPLTAGSAGMMRLGRFCPHGDAPIVTQCRTYRSDVLVYGMFRDGYLRLRRAGANR